LQKREEKKVKLEVARNMLVKNMAVSMISELTGLSEEEISQFNVNRE